MKCPEIPQSVATRLTMLSEHALEFNCDLYDYRGSHPNEPHPWAGSVRRHRSASARPDGNVDHPVILPNLLMMAEPRDNLTTRRTLSNQGTICHQIVDNDFRKKIAVSGRTRVISFRRYAANSSAIAITAGVQLVVREYSVNRSYLLDFIANQSPIIRTQTQVDSNTSAV
jgi:hypothetical protein